MRTKPRKTTGPKHNEVMVTPEFDICVRDISDITNLKEFLVTVADLLTNRPYMQRWEPVRYSPTTGKPVQFEWKPYGAYDGTAYFPGKAPRQCRDVSDDDDDEEEEVDDNDAPSAQPPPVVMSAAVKKAVSALRRKHKDSLMVFSVFDECFVVDLLEDRYGEPIGIMVDRAVVL